MNRKQLAIKYDSLVHLLCDDGYITAAGVEGENLFIRRGDETTLDGDPMPLLRFETSVFRVVVSSHGSGAPPVSAAAKESGEDGYMDSGLLLEHYAKVTTEPEVTFGMHFTLVHNVTQMQVAVLPSKPSALDTGCVRAVLVPQGDVAPAYCEFVFVSRYKNHDEGEPVCRGDEVLIRLAAHPIFLHITSPAEYVDGVSGTNEEAMDPVTYVSRSGPSSLFQLSPNAAFQQRFPPAKATVPLEVNGSEERGFVFVVERYDINHSRANYQRALHRIPRPYVRAGVSLALFHRERNSLLATSHAAPRAVAPVSEVTWIPGDKEWDADDPVPFATRKKNTAANGIETARGTVRCEGSTFTESLKGSTGGSTARSGTSIPLLVEDIPVKDGGVWSCTTLWVMESEDPRIGGAVQLSTQRYRLRQACSNTYLAVSGPGVDTLFSDTDEPLDRSIGKTGDKSKKKGVMVGTEVMHLSGQQLETSSMEMERAGAAELCMIPPPQNERDLRRTLFTVIPMFASECGYLIEGDNLLLQNVLTKLYVSTHEADQRLFLQQQPSVCDTVVVRCVPQSTQYDVFYVCSRCEQLRKYRDAFQHLIPDQLPQEDMQGSRRSVESEGRDEVDNNEAREFAEDDAVPQPFVRSSLSFTTGHTAAAAAASGSLGNGGTQAFVDSNSRSNDDAHVSLVTAAYVDLFPLIALCQETLAELIRFCSSSYEPNVFRRDGIPFPARQRVMFDLYVHRLILEVILAPFVRLRGTGDLPSGVFQYWNTNASLPSIPYCGGVVALRDVLLEEHAELHTVCRLGFRFLRQMIRRSPSLKLGFEPFIPHFLALDGYRFSAMDLLTELFVDNTTIGMDEVKRVIDYVATGLRCRLRSAYIELIGSMCTLGFRGVPARQAEVCARLLTQIEDGPLPRFTSDAEGRWAIALPSNATPELAADLLSDPEGQRAHFVTATVHLLARLCYDGCSPLCCEAVARVFPADAALAALRTFVWTGAEVPGAMRSLDELRAQVLRLTLHCHMGRRIGDVAAQLCAKTVLFGASRLRHREMPHGRSTETSACKHSAHYGGYDESTWNGVQDDDVTKAAKFATLQILRANPRFHLGDPGHSRLLFVSVYVWMRLASSRQCTDAEARELVPLLFALLDVSHDVADEAFNRTAVFTFTRLQASEFSTAVMKARELACCTLRFILDSAAHRGADEMIVYLHNAFVHDSFTTHCPQSICESPHMTPVRVLDETMEKKVPVTSPQAKGVQFERRDDRSHTGEKQREREQKQGQEAKKSQKLSPGGGGANDEREPLLQISSKAPPSSNANECVRGGYQSTGGDAVVERSRHKHWEPLSLDMRAQKESDGRGRKLEEEMYAIGSSSGKPSIDPNEVVEYLHRVCNRITRLLKVEVLIPLLVELTRRNASRLTAQAMELLVSLCTIRRAVAQRVLLIHTLPAATVLRDFDDFHDAAVQVLRLIGPQGTSGDAAAVELAVALVLDSAGGPRGDDTKSEEGETSDSDDMDGVEESVADPADTHDTHAGQGSREEEKKNKKEEEEEEESGEEEEEELGGAVASVKIRGLWAKTAAAARVVSYSRAVRERRRALGLSASSRVSMRGVVRAEMAAHWRLHVPLLRLQRAGGLDPQSAAFVGWMRFFYRFTRSRDCARLLSTHLHTFVALLGAREDCDVACLHIVLAILGTVSDPTPQLTPKLLAAFAAHMDREAVTAYPDDDFVRVLSANIFAKPAVHGVARRRMLVEMLNGKTALRVLSRPKTHLTPTDVPFIAALMQLLCDVCGTSMSAIAMGQRALPVGDACALVMAYGTRCSPLAQHRSPLGRPCGFELFGAYLAALVALHMAVAEERGATAERAEWMNNNEWWSVVQLLASLTRGVAERIDADAKAKYGMNSGIRMLQRYRAVWFITIPVALVTFMTRRFDDGAFYHLRHTVGPVFEDLCVNLAQFLTRVLAHAAALDLHVRDVAHYRQLVQLLVSHTRGVAGLSRIASELRTVQVALHAWLKAHLCGTGSRDGDHEEHDKSVCAADRDADNEEVGALIVTEGISQLLQGSGGRALYLAGARAKCNEVEDVRTALRSFVRRDVLIPLHDSAARHTEPAAILNAHLRRCAELSSVQEFVTSVLNGMLEQSFSPITSVGLLNALHNAVRTALDDSDKATDGKSGGHDDKGIGHKSEKLIASLHVANAGRELQIALSNLGAMRVAATTISVDDAVLTYSAVRLGVALLDGGNAHVQDSALAYFETHQEAFFRNARHMLQRGQEWVQRVNTAHQLALIEMGSVRMGVANAQQITSTLLAQANSSTYSFTSDTNNAYHVMGWGRVPRIFRTHMFCALLRLLQLFCEGHNLEMQNYIRSQHDNLHSANILHEVMHFLKSLSEVVHPSTYSIIVQGFDLLTELCQGPCHSNQEALLSFDVCPCICRILDVLNQSEMAATSGNLSHDVDGGMPLACFMLSQKDMGRLRMSISIHMLSLIEGCRSQAVFEHILSQVPVEYIERELATAPPEIVNQIIDDEEFEDDPIIAAAFNWLIFLNAVRPFADEAYRQRIDEILRHNENLSSRLGCIEVCRDDGLLEKVFFRIPIICSGLTQSIKDGLLWNVDRSSRLTKLSDFLHRSDNLIFEVEQTHAFQRWVIRWTRFRIYSGGITTGTGPIHKKQKRSIMSQTITRAKMFYNYFIAPILFSYNMSFYEYSSILVAIVVNTLFLFLLGVSRLGIVTHLGYYIVAALCIVQFNLSCIALGIETFVLFPICLYVEYRNKQWLAGRTKLNTTMKEVLNGLTMREIVRIFSTKFTVQFRIFLVLSAAISVVYSYYFAAAHLVLIVYKTPTLRTYVSAITQNGKPLLLSVLLGMVVLYFFAIVGYIVFPSAFGGDKETGENCKTLLRCFTFILWQGLRQGGGVGDVMDSQKWTDNNLLVRVSYDLLFFAFVNVIFLNIMFGIIIDTFGELRDDKREKELDMHSTCFICGLRADVLERGHVGGLRAHVREEHNMWMYLYFMHYLRRKDPTEFTGQESYVSAKIERGVLTFFPEEESMALEVVSPGEDDPSPRGARGKEGSGPCRPFALARALKELEKVRESLDAMVQDASVDAGQIKSMLQQAEMMSGGARRMPVGESGSAEGEMGIKQSQQLVLEVKPMAHSAP